MRKVLKSTDEVMHYWANKVQSEGRAGNVFFEGDKVYSYGRHFVIARHLPDGVVAFSNRGYSPSTGKHQSAARSAARHLRTVFCEDADNGAARNMDYARKCIRNRLDDAANKPRIRQATRDGLRASALRIAENANAYLAALPADERGNETPIDTANLEGIRAELDAIEAQRAERERERIAEAARKAQERVAEWRAGADVYVSNAIPPMLRLSKSCGTHHTGGLLPDADTVGVPCVQTSWRAEIPVSHALRLWPLLERVRKAGAEWNSPPEKAFPVGVYTLRTIKADGSIVVGCHDIAYSEIEGIARALGLLETTEA